VLPKVLVLLLVFPMLQPQGFCFCRLVPLILRAVEQKSESSPPTTEETVTAPTCNCCDPNCRHRRSHQDPAQKTRSTSTDPSPGRDSEPKCPPGCPAHPSYAANRATTADESAPPPVSVFPHGPRLVQVPQADLDPPIFAAAGHDLPPPLCAPRFLLCCQFRC
jgi:hypothetical protein